MKVTRDGRQVTVAVSSDAEGLVSHAGSALLSRIANETGLTSALTVRLGGLKQRRSGHDLGRVVRDLAVMLADGGDCLVDLGALGEQSLLFGEVASSSTAFRVIDRIATDPDGLERLRAAHAVARSRAWKLAGAPERLDIDLDATLVTSHSEKEDAAGTFKGGFGFHPMLAYGDQTGEALAAELRPGNAGANTAEDQIAVAEAALEQIPAGHIERIVAHPGTGAVALTIETKATGVPKHPRNPRQPNPGGRAGSADLEKRIKEVSFKNSDIKAEAARLKGKGDSKITARFHLALDAATLPRRRFHDLRHSLGTAMAGAGVPLRTLQAWMGHANFQTTLIYSDYSPSEHEAYLIARAFSSSRSSSHSEGT